MTSGFRPEDLSSILGWGTLLGGGLVWLRLSTWTRETGGSNPPHPIFILPV